MSVINTQGFQEGALINELDAPVQGEIGNNGNYLDNFGLQLDHAGLFRLAGDFGTLNGSIAILNGKKSVATGQIKNGVLVFNKGKAALLDGNVTYSIQIKNSDKGKTASEYEFKATADKLFKLADNSDDWTDMKTAGASGHVAKLGKVAAAGTLVSDGWVGYGDVIDYMAITLDTAASLSFAVDADDATKFTVWQLNEKSGKYSLKSLQSTTLKAAKGTTNYTALSKNLLLTAGTYYISMQSTNAKKGGDADYQIAVNANTKFFTKGDNSDDWTDMKTAGAAGDVANLGKVATNGTLVADGWVGYGDAIDYLAITLDTAASLSFAVNADDATKLTVWQLNEKSGKYSLKSLQSTALKAAKGTTDYTAATKNLLLNAGMYYISIQSTNAEKGGDADYQIEVNRSSIFFPAGNNTNDTWKAVANRDALEVDDHFAGWVGYGDATDFFKFEIEQSGAISLDFDDETARSMANKELKLSCLDANGKSVALTALEPDVYTGKKEFAAGVYYLGVSCTNVKKFNTTYDITLGMLA